MGKYLELFRGEVGDLTEKTKPENKPYVAYLTKEGRVVYTVVPSKDPMVEGPADNEIWYTTSDGSRIYPNGLGLTDNPPVDFLYVDGVGVIRFNNPFTTIIDYCFEYQTKLTSIILPNSVTSIGSKVFFECSAPTSITFTGTMEEWNSITKASDWNYNTPATVIHCTDGDVAL